jgi:hypothetical protein
MNDNLLLDLTPRQVEVIRQALRLQEQQHQRNDFKTLVSEVQDLRSYISNALIDMSQGNLTKA